MSPQTPPEHPHRTRGLLLSLVFLVALAGFAVLVVPLRLPDRLNPWAPPNLGERPNFLTTYKLKRLQDDPQMCRAVLADSAFRAAPVPDRVAGAGCEFENALRVAGSAIAYSSGFIATCPLVVALALFESHVLQPAAEATFGQPVVGIDHLGTYACRNVNNRDAGRRSEHATANAIDIAGFRLKDGRRIVLPRDWGPPNAPPTTNEARFLRDVHKRACGIFGSVLGPNYNAAHRDHFHMDLGPFSICR